MRESERQERVIVTLMRHPAIGSLRKNCIGQTDVEISPEGRAMFELLVEKGASLEPERIICSDLQRCRLLAEAIAKRVRVSVEVDSLWREIHFGEWEARTWDDIRDGDRDGFEQWVQNFTHMAPPGGESFLDLQRRALKGLEKLNFAPESRLLVITHAGLIRSLLCALTGFPEKRAFDIPAPYGAYACFQRENAIWSYLPESGAIQIPAL